MDDDALDRALRAVDPGVGDGERETAMLDHLVERTRAEVPRRRPAGRRWRIGLGIGGFVVAGALVAGVTYQDYLLTIPPFAGLLEGEQRTTTGWVMSPAFGEDAGERCVLYPEFRRLTSEQFSRISEYVRESPEWDSLGRDAARAAGLPPETAIDGNGMDDDRYFVYLDAMTRLVHERVQEVLPELPFRARFSGPDIAAADPPSFEGWTMSSCLPVEAGDQ